MLAVWCKNESPIQRYKPLINKNCQKSQECGMSLMVQSNNIPEVMLLVATHHPPKHIHYRVTFSEQPRSTNR